MMFKSIIAVTLGLSATLVSGTGIGTAITEARLGREKKPMISKSTPILHVARVEPSVKFWTERFGFQKTISVPEGDHLGFVAVEGGGLELMYQTYSGMKSDAGNPLAAAVDEGPTFLFMEVPDINAIINALKGVDIVLPLYESSYGAKEVAVREPGGHFVIFSQMPQR
jgi:uncharacterized glyoxalase superfamily protein PhnB